MRTEDGYLISRCLAGESETFGLLVDVHPRKLRAEHSYFPAPFCGEVQASTRDEKVLQQQS